MYKTLEDAAAKYGLTGLNPGWTGVWYRRPVPFDRDYALFDPLAPEKTHSLLGRIAADEPEAVFGLMQGEVWSPEGEAREMIKGLGLHHTSMSTGDIVEVMLGKFVVCESFGWRTIGD